MLNIVNNKVASILYLKMQREEYLRERKMN